MYYKYINIMLCSNIDLDKVVKTTSRKSGSYKNFFIRYKDDNNKKISIEVMLPKCKIPYFPKEVKNKNGDTFMKEINLNISPEDPHGICFKKYITDLTSKIEEILDIPLKSSFFETQLIKGSLFPVKLKKKFGEDNYDCLYFNEDKELIEDYNLNDDPLKGKLCSGIIKLEKIWSSNKNGGLEWSLVEIRDYGAYKEEE